MAGWSILADGSVLDRSKSPQKLETTGFLVDLETVSNGSSFSVEPSKPSSKSCEEGSILSDKLRCLFDHFYSVLLKEICAHETLRPIPPILGEGQCADLFKLFLAVREKGGCNAVSKNGLWGSVAEESGLGLKFAAAVKLVYIKYLDTFERWLNRIVVDGSTDPELCFSSIGSDVGQFLMELQDEFKGFLPDRKAAAKANDGSFSHLDLSSYNLFFGNEEKHMMSDVKKSEVVVELDDHDDDNYNDEEEEDDVMILDPATVDEEKLSVTRKRKEREESYVKLDEDGEEKSLVVELDIGKSSDNSSSSEEVRNVDSGTLEEANAADEGSRESLRGLLNWVKTIAKDPGDPVFGSLPEPSKWRSYENVEIWKQVLLAREAIFLRRNVDSGFEQSNWQVRFQSSLCFIYFILFYFFVLFKSIE